MNDLDIAICRNRTASVAGTLSHQGIPVSHQEILVKQKNNKLLFGSNWGESNLALANGELLGREEEYSELHWEVSISSGNWHYSEELL
jgi:hypothetical protein